MAPGDDKTINGHLFKNFGSHTNEPDTVYLTAAASIGIDKDEIELFIKRLQKVLHSIHDSSKEDLHKQ